MIPIALSAQSWEEAQKTKSASLDLHWFVSKPFIYQDANQNMQGLEAEIQNLFKQYLKEKYEIDLTLNWKESTSFYGIIEEIERINSPNHIGISAFSITEERKKIVDYTAAYMPDITVLVASPGTPIVRNFEEIDDMMSGMTAITISGTVYESHLLELQEKLGIAFDIHYIQSDENVLDNISKISNTFGFIDLPIYLIWLKNGQSLVRQNYFTVLGTGYGFVLPKGSDWSVPYNEFLSDPEIKSAISEIISQHISSELFEFINTLYEGDLLGTSILTKEKEIQLALIENAKLKLEQEQLYKEFLIGGIILSLVFLLLFTYAFIRIRKSNRQLLGQKRKIESQQEDIQRKNDQLINRNAKLVALNEEKNYLVSILAHDLRGPLTGIMGYSGLLSKGAVLEEKDKQKYLESINGSAHRMNKMINKILGQNVLAGGEQQVLKEKIDIIQLSQDIYSRYLPYAQRKSIGLILDLPKGSSLLETDYLLLQLILENLLGNAIKFSEGDTTVTFGVKSNEKGITFSIADQGPGFTSEDQANLYSRLKPLSAKPTGDETSTGLGLSIVKKYVTELGGKVWLESEVGKGSTFYVMFSSYFSS